MSIATNFGPNPPGLKVVGLGLARTGTLSLCLALESLGFGPCHHPTRLGVDTDFYVKLGKVAKANTVSTENFNDLYRGYVSALNNPAVLFAEQLYSAYPDAKFILTVRDPDEWELSMKKTLLPVLTRHGERGSRITSGIATKEERNEYEKGKKIEILQFVDLVYKGYHQGRMETDPKGELSRHNERIIKLIPPEKLLVFDVSQGWKPLVDFLGVPEPTEPFPHVNNPDAYQKRVANYAKLLA